MSIPLVQEATKDAINTSIIAIKRNIERINMLLGLVDSGSDPDLSGLATKQELQDAVTELTPVDEVTSGNMHSVTSNAVAKQNVLSAFETFSLTETNQQVQYDGFLLVRTKGNGTWGCSVYVNDTEVSTSYAQATAAMTVTIPVVKGDNVRYTGSAPNGTKARFYKTRDYS